MTTTREAALPLADAPKDHTMLWLLVDYSGDGANPLEDKILGWTIGHNGFDHTGVDEWEFAGWSWEQDCFTQGVGNVVGWYPLQRPDQQPDTPATEPQGYVEGPQFRALKTCKGCAHFKSEYWREPSGDGETYDSGTSADCLKAGRSISTYHGSEPAPPDWCPLAAIAPFARKGE